MRLLPNPMKLDDSNGYLSQASSDRNQRLDPTPDNRIRSGFFNKFFGRLR